MSQKKNEKLGAIDLRYA